MSCILINIYNSFIRHFFFFFSFQRGGKYQYELFKFIYKKKNITCPF